MRGVARLAIALAALVALAAAIEWGVGQVSMEGRRASVEHALSAALGREVRFGGEFRLEVLPRPVLEATDVSVASAPGRPAPDLLRIDELRLELALWPLLERRFHLVGVEVAGADLRLEAGGEGRPDARPLLERLAGEGSDPALPLAVRVDRLELRDAQVAWLDAASGEHTALRLDAFEVEAGGDEGPIEWSATGALRGGAFDLSGRGGSLAALLRGSEPWPFSLEGRAGEATVRLDGSLAQPTRLQGLDLDLEIALPDVGSLLAKERARPGLGAARLRGHLVDPGGEPGLDRLALESDPDAELRLRVQGSLRRLADPSGVELEGEIEADRLRFLELLLERPLPEASLRAKFRLSDRDGTIGLDGEAHARSRDGSLAVDLAGGFDDLRARDALDARLRLAAPDLATLGRLSGLARELPAVGPVSATARLRAVGGAFGVEELALEAGRRKDAWLALRGSVRDVEALRGVALEGSFAARSLAELGRALRLARPLPDLGPVDGRAALGDATGTLGVRRFELRGGTPAKLSVELAGSLADLRRLDAVEVEARLQARDATVLGALLGVELPPVGPLGFSGRVRGSDERLETEGTASLGQTRLEGRGSAELAAPGRPRVAAELRSAHVRLEDLGLGSRRAAPEAASGPAPPPWRGREPLPFEELRRLDARLSLQADRVTSGSSVEVTEARATLALEDGDLRVRDLELEYQGGAIQGDLHVDARTPDPAVALRLGVTALDLARLGAALGSPEATGSGQLDLALDLRSGGPTLDALRERLAGRLAVAARDWSAASSYARRFLMDLSRAFLPSSPRAPERLGCLQGALRFAAGVGEVETLVLAGEQATVVGAGRVDLAHEQWHLELVPKVHDPKLLSLAAAVRVTGPLAAPRFEPVPLDVVAGALRGLARGALAPARSATAGARRVLGPAGRILSPLDAALGLAAGASKATEPRACELPAPGGASPGASEEVAK